MHVAPKLKGKVLYLQASGSMRAPGKRREPFFVAMSMPLPEPSSVLGSITTPSCKRPPSARMTGWPFCLQHKHKRWQ